MDRARKKREEAEEKKAVDMERTRERQLQRQKETRRDTERA